MYVHTRRRCGQSPRWEMSTDLSRSRDIVRCFLDASLERLTLTAAPYFAHGGALQRLPRRPSATAVYRRQLRCKPASRPSAAANRHAHNWYSTQIRSLVVGPAAYDLDSSPPACACDLLYDRGKHGRRSRPFWSQRMW